MNIIVIKDWPAKRWHAGDCFAAPRTEFEIRRAMVAEQVSLHGGIPVPMNLHKNNVSRNNSCPCGSGKKFKKCCRVGVDTTILPVTADRSACDLTKTDRETA